MPTVQAMLPVFPAYAGMIPVEFAQIPIPGGVPRIRGDDPPQFDLDFITRLCSPHTRG